MGTRYLSYVEDIPMKWTKAFHDPLEAIKATEDFVMERGQKNGSGTGAVLDTTSDQIIVLLEVGSRGCPDDPDVGHPDVGVDFLPLPKGPEHARMARVVRQSHNGTHGPRDYLR